MRLTKEREAEIKEWLRSESKLKIFDDGASSPWRGPEYCLDLLAEIDALRDENAQLTEENDLFRENRTNIITRELSDLREKFEITINELKEIVACGEEAHMKGTADAHSFYFGIAIGKAFKLLEQIQGKDNGTL